MNTQKCEHVWQERGYSDSESYRINCEKCNISWFNTRTGKVDSFMRDLVGCILLIPIILFGLILFPLIKFLDWWEGNPVISR